MFRLWKCGEDKMKIPNYIKEILDENPKIGRLALADATKISEQEARFYCKLYKDSRNDTVKRGVAVGDLHYPYDNKACKEILFKFLEDFKPELFIFTGDMLDMDTISFFNRSKPKLTENKRLSYDYRGFQRAYLDRLKNTLPDDCYKYWLYGNHEERVNRLIEEKPQYEGFIEIDKNLDLSDWEEVKYNDSLSLGEMNFIHGHWYNKHHALKNVSTYGKQIFSWHVHTHQSYTMHSPVNRLPKQGVSVGCMCDKNPEWLRNKPNNWVHQFMYFYLFGDGSFTYYLPTIINGRVYINDKLYG